jgi:hypothetical protein
MVMLVVCHKILGKIKKGLHREKKNLKNICHRQSFMTSLKGPATI